MRSIDEQISIFPTHFVPENQDAIDFNTFNVIAVGCGSSINFSYVEDFQLKQAFSISIGRRYVSALRFHPSNELLFIGDSKGNLHIFDYQRRVFVSQPFQFEDNSCISQISFVDTNLIVLNKKCVFACLEYSNKNSDLYNFNYIWKTVLPDKTTNFSIDPFRKSRIFIYGRNTNFFMLYTIDKSSKSIKASTEQLFLTNNLVFQDAQFSLHLRNYIFFMTELKFMLYNVEHNIVISISHFQKASSFLHRFIQFPSDDSKLLCFNKSGAMTIFEVQSPFNLVSIAEIPFVQQEQQLFMQCLSTLRDDYLAVVYSPLGLTLFDLSTFKMVSILAYWCDKTTTFTMNGINYAIGTEKGYIVYGNLFKPEEKAVFQISKKPITFLSIIPTQHIIYWATEGAIGEIDTGFRRVTRFPKHCLSTQKMVGTNTGGFLVQRESCVLGLFIDGTEICIPTNHPIIDFCFNEELSTNSNGSVMLILEIGIILFFEYSKVHGVNNQYIKRTANFNVNYESCSTWLGQYYAFGFKDGTVMKMKADSVDYETFDLGASPIKKVQYCENELFALTDEGFLFSIKDSNYVECSNLIRNFYVVGTNLLAVIKFDYSVTFIKRARFEPLSVSSKSLPLPDRATLISNFLFSNPVLLNTNYIIQSEEEDQDLENEFKGNIEFDKIHSLGNLVSKGNMMRLSQTPKRSTSNRITSPGRRAKKTLPQRSYSQIRSIGSSKLVSDISENSEDVLNFSDSQNTQNSEDVQNSEGIQISDENRNSDEIQVSDESGKSSDLHIEINANYNEQNTASFQSSRESYSSTIETDFGVYVPRVFNKDDTFDPFNRIIPYATNVGRDCWLHLLKVPSLRLMNICALGNSSRYESTLAEIISLLDYSPALQPIIFDHYLFAHRVEDADKVLSKESPTSPNFMIDSIIGTALITFDEEMTEEQIARIKSAGISLIMNNKRKLGAALLRIAKLDSVAASYLIQAGHPLEAMRFVRWLTSDDEKKRNTFEVAIKYYEKSRFKEAALLFMTSGEYHPALFCLTKLRLIYDAYVIKAFLMKKKMLKEVKGQKALGIPNLLPLKKLCQTIDAQFASLLGRNGIDAQKFKLLVKPRALSTL